MSDLVHAKTDRKPSQAYREHPSPGASQKITLNRKIRDRGRADHQEEDKLRNTQIRRRDVMQEIGVIKRQKPR